MSITCSLPSKKLQVVAEDVPPSGTRLSASAQVVVDVTDVNDNAPVITSPGIIYSGVGVGEWETGSHGGWCPNYFASVLIKFTDLY